MNKIQKENEEKNLELRKRNPWAPVAVGLQDKCAVIRCGYKKIRGCDGFCREHYRKTLL